MFDAIENYFKCEHTPTCEICEYFSICKLFTRHKYINFDELDALFTIHYAEGEI